MVNEQTPYTWDFGMLNKKYPLNMTQTTAPSLTPKNNLIKLNFDGTFHMANASGESFSNHAYFPDIPESHREQLWVHENTLNSFLMSAAEDLLPYTIDTDSLSISILQALPELKSLCGSQSKHSEVVGFDDKCKFSVSLNKAMQTGKDQMISITQNNGITLGGSNLKIDIMYVNSTVTKPVKVAELETAFAMNVNFTM
jgi:hypothetical protein